MAHTQKDQKRIISRIRRIKGQLTSIENSIEEGEECYKVLQTLASCRGALSGLMGEMVAGHIRDHIVAAKNSKEASEAGEETIQIMQSFWK